MSIDNPLVIINTLTAANIQQQNTIDDLNFALKAAREKNAELCIDKNKRIKKLEEAIANRPKYEQPLVEQLERQVERTSEKIAGLEQQLSIERCAGAYLRTYFIKNNQDSVADLCQSVVDQVKASNRDKEVRFKGGLSALSPIHIAMNHGFKKKQVQDAMDEIRSMQERQP